jgi:hypothetical protein
MSLTEFQPEKDDQMPSTSPLFESTAPIVVIVPSARLSKTGWKPNLHSFSLAVKAAIAAYAQTGRMVDAALAYAAHGIAVFPVSIDKKKPIPRRDIDEDGNPIGGTGGFKKATTDPIQIRAWWGKNGRHLIGVPMGLVNKIWTLDVDTTIEHDDDGVAALKGLTVEYGAINTRAHRTATDGLHLIMNWTTDNPIGCSKGLLPKGMEVKGQGGYIVVPPSRRKGNAYTVSVGIDPTDAPGWLYDLIGRRKAKTDRYEKSTLELPWDKVGPVPAELPSIWDSVGLPAARRDNEPFASVEELADALRWIPNNLDWNDWSAMGLAIWAATNGNGLDLWIAFSKKSSAYDYGNTLARWNGISGSPPNRTGCYYIFKRALANGWKRTPTYSLPQFDKNETARNEIRRVGCEFLSYDRRPKNVYEAYGEQWAGSTAIVWAERIDTGLGKTRIIIEEIAKEIARSDKCFVYTVPTLKLGEDIERQFRALGVKAKLFRGREADDPNNPGSPMCLEPAKVKMAFAAKQDISETCCKFKDDVCPLFARCGYQIQKIEGVRAWIVAAEVLFHEQPALGKPQALIIDETFWESSLRGVDDNERWEIPLASLAGNHRAWRRILAFDFSQQEDNGGVQRRVVENMEIEFLNGMIAKEYRHLPELGLRPGMSGAQYKLLQKNSAKLISNIVFSNHVIKILKEMRHMVQHPDIEVSGRLQLVESNQQRVITWRGVDTIKNQFQIPTLLIDATLPNLEILRVLHPEAEIVADIRVPMPKCVKIRQVLKTPTSSFKLIKAEHPEKHLEDVRRYILRCYFETDRGNTLVIVQKEVEEYLNGKLPDNISLEHFNAIAGLDKYKNVRLQILIGRTQPGPEGIEAQAATLSGEMPKRNVPQNTRFKWYRRVIRSIRLRDGTGVAVLGDHHPDPFCESVRYQKTEDELIQALGRGRGVNRTKQTPLDIDLLFDTVLPITVDEVTYWDAPSLFYATAFDDGVMLESPVDLMKVWPALWPNRKAASRCIKEGVPNIPGFESVVYQLAGAKMKQRVGHFDLSKIPDPRLWLERNLGSLAT